MLMINRLTVPSIILTGAALVGQLPADASIWYAPQTSTSASPTSAEAPPDTDTEPKLESHETITSKSIWVDWNGKVTEITDNLDTEDSTEKYLGKIPESEMEGIKDHEIAEYPHDELKNGGAFFNDDGSIVYPYRRPRNSCNFYVEYVDPGASFAYPTERLCRDLARQLLKFDEFRDYHAAKLVTNR